MKNKDKVWYSPNDIMSRNNLINFIIGMRGGGKTFNLITFCVKRFLKHGHQFTYIRRFDNELKKSKKTFFDAHIKEGIFKGIEFEVKGDFGYINGQKACVFIAMTGSAKYKSVALPDVMYSIYDEFVPQGYNPRYLDDEPLKFMELNESINRMRLDGRADVRTFFIANAMTVCNPYFDFFKINLEKEILPRFTKSSNKNISAICEYYTNNTFAEMKRATDWGQLMEATGYSSYAIDNKFLYDNNNLICKVDKKRVLYSVVDSKFALTFWRYTDDDGDTYIHVTDKNKQNIKELTFYIDETIKELKTSNLFAMKESGVASQIKKYNSCGHVTFDNQKCKQNFIKLHKML